MIEEVTKINAIRIREKPIKFNVDIADYIAKPFTKEQIQEKLKKVFNME